MENQDVNHSEAHTDDDLVKLIENLEVLDDDSDSNSGSRRNSDSELELGEHLEIGSASANEASRDIPERIRMNDDEEGDRSPPMTWADVLRETVYMHAAFRIAAIVDGAVELGDRIARDARGAEADDHSTRESMTCAKSKCTSTNRKRDEIMSKTRPHSGPSDENEVD